MFIKFVDIDWLFFCVILTLVCFLRACHMWLTRNHMFIHKLWGKFILNFPLKHVITSTNKSNKIELEKSPITWNDCY